MAEIAGFARGTIILSINFNSLQPSMRAASEISSGIDVKNWRSRNIENALEKKEGTISGKNDGIQCSLAKMMYTGIIVTCPGNIIVDKIITKVI